MIIRAERAWARARAQRLPSLSRDERSQLHALEGLDLRRLVRTLLERERLGVRGRDGGYQRGQGKDH